MSPDLWFDPSGGGFGVSPSPGVGPTGGLPGAQTGVVYSHNSQTGESCWGVPPIADLGGNWSTWTPDISGNWPSSISSLVPGQSVCIGGIGPTSPTLPAGLGTGSGGIQPPTEQPPSTCPQCGCVTCQCQSQQSEPPQRSCYLLPNNQYVWLTQSDEVPTDATPCSGITPIQPQPTETVTPTGTTAIPVQDQQEPPAPPCITQFPFGSPDWCKCAELWRQLFNGLGTRLLQAFDADAYDANGVTLNVFWLFNNFIPTGPSITGNLDVGAVMDWCWTAWGRVFDLYDEIYGANSPEILGIEYMRSVLDCAESWSYHTSGAVNKDDHQQAGVTIFGIGTGYGEKDSQDQSADGSIHFVFREVRRALDQLAKYFAPITPASTGDGVSIFLAGGIDLAGLQCVFAANGVHPGWAEQTALASRSRPLPLEWISYWRRGKITDQQLATVLRGSGYILPDEQQVLVTVSEVIPPPTDLVRFMLRSIGDPNIVQRFQLEDEFDQLYQGRIKEWAIANGISEAVLRAYHAAHWVVPGPGDLAIFWQRFGEDRQSPEANRLQQKMSRSDYDRALREQGIAPFWRPFFVAAQYSVASRRDLQFGYQVGAYSQAELDNALLDLSYSPSVAPRIKKVILSRAVDAWTKDPVVSAYKKNGINQTAMESYLLDRGCPTEVRLEVIRIVRIEATEIANEKLVSLIEKQYELGSLNDEGLLTSLASIGLDADQLNRLVLEVKGRKLARPKQLPAAELCRMYGSLLLSRSEFLQRLVALNYTPNDAELIVAKCELDLEAKQLKQLQLLMKQQSAAERRHLKDLSLAERQAQLAKARDAKALAAQIKAQRAAAIALEREQAKAKAATERAIARAATLAKQAEAEELRIQSLIEKIAEHWSKLTGSDPVQAAAELVESVRTATADGTYTVIEVLRVVESRLVSGTKDYPARLADLVASLLPLIAQAMAIAPEQSTNGEAPTQPIEPTSQ